MPLKNNTNTDRENLMMQQSRDLAFKLFTASHNDPKLGMGLIATAESEQTLEFLGRTK